MKEKILHTTSNKTEAEMIVDILKQNNIIAFYKTDSASVLEMTHNFSLSYNIFVNEEDYEKAKELIAFSLEDYEKDVDFEEYYDKSIKKRTMFHRASLIVFSVLMIALLTVIIAILLK